MTTIKSIGAIVAGLAAGAILSVGTDLLLHNLGVFPGFDTPSLFTTTMLAVATLYRSVFNIAGCFLTALLAPGRPMRHAIILGIMGTLLSALGAVTMWDKSASAPWYPIALIVLALPCAWTGGKLFLTLRALEPHAII